jgi:ribonucleoside-diphosphate reductase alpha chain
MAKRRVGLGFTGLGDALVMLRQRYDSDEARTTGARIAEAMRDSAYRASVELARERGQFPLFNADLYLSGTSFAARLRRRSRSSSAGTAFAIPPAVDCAHRHDFARVRRQRIERHRACVLMGVHAEKAHARRHAEGVPVEDHAWRLYRAMGGDTGALPPYFVTALEISARSHEQMVAAVAPFIDTSISKTVNVPEDYPYEEFEDLYLAAWKSDLKGLATYRPNKILGSVLSVEKTPEKKDAQDFRQDDFNRRIRIRSVPEPGAGEPALARAPVARRRQSRVDLHDRASRTARSPCSSGTWKTAASTPSRSG